MATIYCTVEKKTFVPEKNDFNVELVSIEREETFYELENKLKCYKFDRSGMLSLLIGIFGGFAVLLIFGLLGANIDPRLYFGCIVGLIMILGGIFLAHGWLWEKEKECCEAYNDWYNKHEKELWAEAVKDVKAYNEEQYRIAEAWRAEHPLEEKIRACLLDPKSSTEIANLVRFCAQEYFKTEAYQ